MVQLYEQLGKLEDAVGLLETVFPKLEAEQNRTLMPFLRVLAEMKQRMGSYKEAAALYERLLKEDNEEDDDDEEEDLEDGSILKRRRMDALTGLIECASHFDSVHT